MLRTGRAVPGASLKRGGPGRSAPLLLVVPAAVTAALALLPLAYVLIRAFQDGVGTLAETLFRGRTLELLLRSIGLTATVAVGCLVIGVGLAFLVARTRLPGGRLWALVATLPLAIPSYVAAMVWIEVFPGLRGFTGAALVLTLCCYPYVFLPVVAALQRADRDQEEVARSLGKGAAATFFQVTLRQVQPAAAAGTLLAALYVLSDFGSVATMRYDVFTRAIYNDYANRFDMTSAATLSLVLVAVILLILWGESRMRGRARFSRLGSGATRIRPRRDPGREASAAVTTALGPAWAPAARVLRLLVTALTVLPFVLVAALSLGFPMASLVYWIVRGSSTGFDLPRLAQTAATTLGVSAAGAAFTMILALPVGILAARHRGRLPQLLERATWTGYSLPGVVVALSLVFFAVNHAYPLYQQTPLLIFAYALLFLPAAVGAVRAAVAQAPPDLEEVARSLGRSPASVFTRVTLPLASPGVAAGAALVFLTCMKELPATLMLHPTGMETIAMRLWKSTHIGEFAAAAPYALLLIVLASVPAFVLGHKANGWER